MTANVVLLISCAGANAFDLASSEISEGGEMPNKSVFDGFGCHGNNQSPSLTWSSVPSATKSFAVTVYDPDAPTGSGWWHWIVYDIPASSRGLIENAGVAAMPLTVGKQGINDFGNHTYGGACPPENAKPHRYVFTVYALKSDSISVPENASAALIGFSIQNAMLAKASITVHYSR